MNTLRNKLSVAVAALLIAAPIASPAQAPAPAPATIHGHVQNPAGMSLTSGFVKLTQDRSAADDKSRKYLYSFPIDGTGNFKGAGINPGDYLAVVFSGQGTSIDFLDHIALTPGLDKDLDFDMTRKEYMDKMSPEEKKALEDYKKQNAATVAANAVVANLNQSLTSARADMAAKKYDSAAETMKKATDSKPDEPILWLEYGNALLGSADTAAAEARKNGKVPSSDPDVSAKYASAANAFGKVKELSTAPGKKSNPEVVASALDQQGAAFGKAGKVTEAQAAYDEAATANPTRAKTYYFNEAATFYNSQQLDAAAAAADKSIAADPANAMAYYIKGQSLIPKASVDAKTNKITAPPGCVEAYQKYLELDPTGPHADEVKGILQGIGAEVKSIYKAAPTKKK